MDGKTLLAAVSAICASALGAAASALPPVPVPPENPITEPKRVLGKILFWDEQLSSDQTLACGSCHQPRFGGADGRRERGPGADGKLGTEDDVYGSPGLFHLNRRGVATSDKVFGRKPQVGTRAAPSYFGGLWSEAAFWDGRAGSTFIDPESGAVAIPKGGALESQAVAPIVNAVEMAQEDRRWPEVARALVRAEPLALARKLPADVKAAIAARPSYPKLFEAAFGDPKITAARIAFAIATYERTLVADQTPYDAFVERGQPMSPAAQAGLAFFEHHQCHECHQPPLFTNNKFFNIGLRPAFHDRGRREVTGEREDGGRMKTPTLRNIALKRSFTHTGELTTLDDVLELYAAPKAPRDNLPSGGEYVQRMDPTARERIKDFLVEGLVDPRVARETFPFDRPQLRSERAVSEGRPPSRPVGLKARAEAGLVRLDWSVPAGAGVDDYVVMRGGRVVAYLTRPGFVDDEARLGRIYRYRVLARSAAGAPSRPATVWIATPWGWIWPVAAGGLAALLASVVVSRRNRRGERSASRPIRTS